MNPQKKKLSKDDILFNKMGRGICAYLKTQGWKIIVVGDTRIQRPFGSDRYNFELVFNITAIKLPTKNRP